MTDLLDTPRRIRSARAVRNRRAYVITTLLAVVAFVLFVISMMVGSYAVSAPDVLASVLHLRDNPSVDFIVRDLRLPTALAGLAVGVALGVSGQLFQRVLGNPLASPDFVGISSGASFFAVSAIVLFDASSTLISGSALVGALLSAGMIYLLAWRDGITGYRFILIGIGITQLMVSLIGYIVSHASIHEAREAMTWLVGSVGQAGSGELRTLLVGLAVLLPVIVGLERSLRALELGDDTAKALGARVELNRLGLLGASIVLVGFAVAVAGPIMFVALIAGPIAQRLVGRTAGGIVAAGCVGAIITLGADLVSHQVLPVDLPTGVVTGLIGAPYLIWLLVTVNKEGRGG